MKTDAQVQRLVDDYGRWFEDPGRTAAGRMTRELYPYDAMFSPIRINRMTVKNRLVMAPMGNISMCEETGRPNDKMIQYFLERAKGGVGLITSGLVPVSFGIDPSIIELPPHRPVAHRVCRLARHRSGRARPRGQILHSAHPRPRPGGQSAVPGQFL